jgi:hypothetical protein
LSHEITSGTTYNTCLCLVVFLIWVLLLLRSIFYFSTMIVFLQFSYSKNLK